MSVIKKDRLNKEQLPLGCEYWAQRYDQRVPHLEVFRFVGFDADTGLYWFMSLTEKVYLSKNMNQLLEHKGFAPFLLKGGKG